MKVDDTAARTHECTTHCVVPFTSFCITQLCAPQVLRWTAALVAVAATLATAVAAAQGAPAAVLLAGAAASVLAAVAGGKLNDLHQAFFYVPYIHQDHH